MSENTERDELADIIKREYRSAVTRKSDDCYTAPADAILAAGYRKPRTITTAAELEALPFGSAVQTSDASDVVVLKSEGRYFRNQSGFELSVEDLWRYGTQPFTVIFEATL